MLSQEAPPLEGEQNQTPEPEDAQASSALPEQTEAPPKDVERVPVPQGRRARAAAAVNDVTKKLEDIQKQLAAKDAEIKAEIARRDQEIANLRGRWEAIQPIVHQNQPKAPDAQQLRKEAKEALDKGDFDGYQEKFAQAIQVETVQAVQRTMPQPGPQSNPVVAALMAQHPAVMAAGDRGFGLAVAYDNVLAAQGITAGPDRYKRAFEMAQADLGGQAAANAKPTFSSSPASQAALSGIPTGRQSVPAQEREPGIVLNEYDIKWMNAAGMTKEEFVDYVAKYQPHRIQK